MLVIQHNYRQGDESIVLVLKIVLSIGIGIVILQKLFIDT